MGENQEIDYYFYVSKVSPVSLKAKVLKRMNKVIIQISIICSILVKETNHIIKRKNISHCILGIIGNKAFADVLLDLVTMNLGTNNFPSSWMNLTQPEVSFYFVWISSFENSSLINKSRVLK